MSPPIVCPYPACPETLTSASSLTTCSCLYRQAVGVCPACGIVNRGDAHICRRCRFELPATTLDTRDLVGSQAQHLTMPGSFRRPPIAANGFLYAVDVHGGLIRLSVRPEARSRQVARLTFPDAAFNRNAAVRVDNPGKGLTGWTFLALSTTAVEAVSLATGVTKILYQPPAGGRLSANASEADGTRFNGLVATSDFCAFGLRPSPDEAVLTLRYFSEDRSIEQPLLIRGTRIMGPALCGGRLVLCSDQEIGLFDPATGAAALVTLPRSFRPLLSRALDLNVPPGHLPLTATLSREGHREAWIGGHSSEGTPGFLRVDFDAHQSQFEPRPGLHTIATNPDGTLCAARNDGLELIGHPAPKGRIARMQAGMPVLFDQDHLCYFPEQSAPNQHRLVFGSDQRFLDLPFINPLCTVDTCGGILFIGTQIVVTSINLNATHGVVGLDLTFWSSAI